LPLLGLVERRRQHLRRLLAEPFRVHLVVHQI
jgi:hypothetical protein